MNSNSTKSIDYRSLITELGSNEQFSGFMELFCKYTDEPYSYTASPLYKYALKFFTPREYCHPTFVECDQSCWDMLLQLLFVSREADCRFVQTEGIAPELVLSYLSLKDVAVSTLSLQELKSLLLCLLTDAFAELLPHIIGSCIDQEYAEQLTDYQSLTREELLRMYGCSEHSSAEQIKMIDHLYSRLCNYYLQAK